MFLNSDEISSFDGVTKAIYKTDHGAYALPEVRLIREQQERWFATLNGYIQVLVSCAGAIHPMFYEGALPFESRLAA